MDLQYPSSPRQDLVHPPAKLQPVPSLFAPGELDEEERGWFFNMKVHHDLEHQPSPRSRKPRHLDPVKQSKTSRGHSRAPRDQSKASREQFRSSKPGLGNRHRKLEALSTPSPAELKEQIEIQTARSIGDSLIFHNIPERCEDTPEEEVVKFCQDYLVGRRIKHVQFGHVHKMEQRFSKDAPIAARFSLVLPGQPDPPEAEKYQPLPYIPAVPKRRLPLLKLKNRRKAQYNANN